MTKPSPSPQLASSILDVTIVRDLVRALQTRGVNAVSREVRASREALTRVAAGLRTHPGTTELVRTWHATYATAAPACLPVPASADEQDLHVCADGVQAVACASPPHTPTGGSP